MKQKRIDRQKRKLKPPQEKGSNISQDQIGYPIYRCDLCYEMITQNSLSLVSLSTLISLMNNSRLFSIGTLQRFIIHECENGSYGIANIAGIVSEKVFLDSKKMPSEIIKEKSVGPN